MTVSPEKAYSLKKNGISVPVICEGCEATTWSEKATYAIGEEEWYCTSCTDEIVEGYADAVESLLDENGDIPEDVYKKASGDGGETDG